MRIAALSRASGVPVPTIKYYLREGLLPAGTPTAPNQADYSPLHVHRLRLIRALLEVGGLGIAAVRAVLGAIGNDDLPLHEVLGIALRALGPALDQEPVPDDVAQARAEVDAFIADLGWQVAPDTPARRALADALVALRRLGRDVGPDVFAPYAALADDLAAREVTHVATGASRAETVERAIVGTVVFESALIALRRLAQAHHSSARLGAGVSHAQDFAPYGRGTRRRR